LKEIKGVWIKNKQITRKRLKKFAGFGIIETRVNCFELCQKGSSGRNAYGKQ